MAPTLTGFDHIHVYVRDREAAARWWSRVMGFRRSEALASWAESPNGPLTVEDASGEIHLAFFREPDPARTTAIAFRTSAEGFLAWKSHLEAQDLLKRVTDHTLAWSLYFDDPDGHMHEITTYEHAAVSAVLDPA